MYQKILVPLDGSELAECTLKHLKAVALGCNVPEVILLRVVEPLSAQTYSILAQAGNDTLKRVEQDRQEDARIYIANTVETLKNEGINAIPVIMHGAAAQEILKYTGENKVDLIIMSTHGRSGISRLFLGSVMDRVLHNSNAPVFIISPIGCRA